MSDILTIGDRGKVDFAVDLSTGMVTVTVREPLALASSTAAIPILDFLDAGANMTLAVNQFQRDVVARMRAAANGTTAGVPR